MRNKFFSFVAVSLIAISAANSQTAGDVLCGAQCHSVYQNCLNFGSYEYQSCIEGCEFHNGGPYCYSACSYLGDVDKETCEGDFAACLLVCAVLGRF
jgi:hypothetical protein